MPLSTTCKAPLQEHHKNEENTNPNKRRHSDSLSPPSKKLCEDPLERMTDTQNKRANFSALSSPSNGFSRHASPLANSKPGSAKKLVIKNFKGAVVGSS